MQLTLFDLDRYDINVLFVRKLFNCSALTWDINKIRDLPKHYIKVICLKFKLPTSGSIEKLITSIKAFIDLTKLIKLNFDVVGKPDNIEAFKLKAKTSTLTEIKPVLKQLKIKNSWLNKKGKLERALRFFVDAWLFRG